MIAPSMPQDFYPEEEQEERIARWIVLEEEARQARQEDLMRYEEPMPPRLPHWIQGCCNESILRYYGG